MRIGVVATKRDCEALSAILEGDDDLVRLGVGAAQAAIRASEIDLLILGPGGPNDSRLSSLIRPGIGRVAVLALIPRDDSRALELAFASGVADCAAYPIDANEIRIRLRALQRRRRLDERLRADFVEAQRLAQTDPVTGLSSRHYLDLELAATLVRTRAAKLPLTLLMIDIDGFKAVNDRFGHAAGDKMLHAIGSRLAVNIRAVDTLARYGGDELVVIMPGVACEAGTRVAERLCGVIAETPIIALQATISIGLASMIDGDDAASLLARADAALYAAKVGGRNRVAQAA